MTMTNRALSLFAAILVAAFSVHAQSTRTTSQLNALLNEFLAGASRNDAAIHDRFWAEDLIYTRSSGARITKQELMKGVRSASPPKTGDPVVTYSAEDVQIRLYGNAAVVAFKLVGRTTKKDGSVEISEFFNTGTFIKRNGLWQAVAWQATPIRRPM